MKRSEMVQIIVECLPDISHVNTTPELMASLILDRMVDAGMLPPKVTLKDPGHFPGDEFSYDSNEWEPENEN